jgi:cob(I)alamin adenosyltransferase
MANLDTVKTASSSILADQERDLLRAFRSRLFDVQTELSRVKAKKEDGASVWITKAKQLEAEVNWATKAADDLAEKNVLMLGDIGELKQQ